MAKLFNRRRNRWRVNQRCHFFDVVDEESVKENLVGVLQSSQVDMSLEITVFLLKSFISADHLLVKGFYVRRQQPAQAKFSPLLLRESGAFVQQRSVQKIRPTRKIR